VPNRPKRGARVPSSPKRLTCLEAPATSYYYYSVLSFYYSSDNKYYPELEPCYNRGMYTQMIYD
jgi:hypothetical protein